MTATEPRAAVDYLRRARRTKAATGQGLEGLELEAPPGSDGRPPVTHFDALPDVDKVAVEGAVAKLDRPEAMTGNERIALEAIIIPDHRPAIAIEQDSYTVTHQDWLHLNSPDTHALIDPCIPAIGRLELPSRADIPYAGTAFLVGHDLLMTNRHVAELFVDGAGRGLTFRPGAAARMNFVEEEERKVTERFDISSVVLVHPYWDMALLRVEGVTAKPLTLAIDAPEHPDEDVVVIGYPAFNPSLSRAVQDRVFGGVYNVKRLQPGRRLVRRDVESFGKTVNAATHDASTLGGNSGSAVISAKSGQVVALHFGGAYLDTNYGVPSLDLARDARLADVGLEVAHPRPVPGDGPWSRWWQEVETTAPLAAAPPAAAPPRSTQAPAVQASITVPLTITVSLGAVESKVAEAPAAALERVVAPWHDTDYADRTGYDPQFLDIAIPLPEVLDPACLARLADGGAIIPYTHFSIAMHATRRLALFTASNVWADTAVRKPDPAADYTRDALGGLGTSDTEQWFPDPRLRGIEQLPDRFFTKDRKAFDKGHLVRRDDVAYGRTYDELRKANGDTYHVTNCSPQVADFNRPKGTQNWGDLEKAVLAQAVHQKLSIFAGPVLADDDPVFHGIDDAGAVEVQIPRAYWKLIVAPDGAGLGAYAFLLEQDLAGVAMEALNFDPAWRRSMLTVAELERRIARLTFPEVLHRADRAGTAAAAAVTAAVRL